MVDEPHHVPALVIDYYFELVEDHHSAGSGRYGLLISFPVDISQVLPYLNGVLEDTRYDHEGRVLVGRKGGNRLAIRPHEIRIATIADPTDAPSVVAGTVELVNHVWAERDRIAPSLRESRLPPVYEIFKCLPRTNCRQCGSLTCLAFAAKLRDGEVEMEQCPALSLPEYAANRQQIVESLHST